MDSWKRKFPYHYLLQLTFFKPLITSILAYAYPAWELVDSYLLKQQYLQNKVLCITGSLPGRIQTGTYIWRSKTRIYMISL
jgi:hypothetical protein